MSPFLALYCLIQLGLPATLILSDAVPKWGTERFHFGVSQISWSLVQALAPGSITLLMGKLWEMGLQQICIFNGFPGDAAADGLGTTPWGRFPTTWLTTDAQIRHIRKIHLSPSWRPRTYSGHLWSTWEPFVNSKCLGLMFTNICTGTLGVANGCVPLPPRQVIGKENHRLHVQDRGLQRDRG